jgi:hypothetical protein
MAQHFLLSAAARSLSAAKIMRMSDRGVENVFLRLRWAATDGKPVCPGCGCCGRKFHPVLFIPVATSDAGMRGGGRALSDG